MSNTTTAATASSSHPITHDAHDHSTTVEPTPGLVPQQSAATSPEMQATEAPAEPKKHGLGALVDKIVHPSGHHSHGKTSSVDNTHAGDVPSVPVAVPGAPSEGAAAGLGGAHIAPGGSAVGGIL